MGTAIRCWCPAEFKGYYVEYTHNYCWIANTYMIPMESTIPQDHVMRRQKQINYYQWVPMILLIMAMLFKLPNIFWHLMNTRTGINPSKVCELVENINIGPPEEREVSLYQIARDIDRWLRECRNYKRTLPVQIRHKVSNMFLFCFAKREGCFLTGYYLFIKVVYCANCIGQFFLLDLWLGMDFGGYGFEIIAHYREHGEWKETPRFPRVTLCDFEIRQLPNIQTYTVQCVLPINLFNEKIFALIWLWLLFVSILSFYNLLSWLCYLLFSHNKEIFVRKYLRSSNEIRDNFDKKLSRRFANSYLRDDGCFLLRIVAKNSTDVVLTDLLRILWATFLDKPFPSCRRQTVEYNEEDSSHEMDEFTVLDHDNSSPILMNGHIDHVDNTIVIERDEHVNEHPDELEVLSGSGEDTSDSEDEHSIEEKTKTCGIC